MTIWIFFERERLRNRFFENLGRLIRHHRARQNYSRAILHAQQILQYDAMREDVVRELIMLRFEAGDRVGALQEYRRFEQQLRTEMDVPPMVETQALYDSIAQYMPTPSGGRATATAAPLSIQASIPPQLSKSIDDRTSSAGNLPAQLTTFVGREQELAALRNVLSASGSAVRLLTLTGPGGSGKTRLALEVAARLRAEQLDTFPNGYFFVALSTITNPSMVLEAICETLNIRENANQQFLDNLNEYLRPKKLLLLLDNFEHLMKAAPLLIDLLSNAPGLRILVTSRAVLHLYGEHEFPLDPLPLPDLEDLSSIQDIVRYASITLFTTRSLAVNSNFTLNRENAATVAKICMRLDGLPLAIELAAARSKVLSPQALLDRLDRRLTFLADRNRNPTERHQTLRATLDWSYQLLSPSEKRLFAFLAVFAGSFSLDAIEDVCCETGDADVLSGLESLVDNSLLQRVTVDLGDKNAGSTTGDGEVRFRLLSTIHEYAQEKLAAENDREAVEYRHVHFYLAVAETAEPELRGSNQGEWLSRLELEHDNLRSGLRWCMNGNGERVLLGLRLCACLGQFWYMAGHFTEGYRWLEDGLYKAIPSIPANLHAKALYALGSLLHAQGDLRRAFPSFEQSLAIYRQLGDRHGIADALYALGRLVNRQKAYAEAERLLQESLTLVHTTGDEYRLAYILNILAGIRLAQGDFSAAEALYQQALTAARRIDNRSGVAFILTAFGELARLVGDYARAESYYNEAMTLANNLRQKARVVMLLHNLAHVALHHNQTQRAAAMFRECMILGMELPDQENFGMCMLGLGGVAGALQQPDRATMLFGAGELILETIGAQLAPADQLEYDRNRARVETQINPQIFLEQWQKGRSLTQDQMQQLALEPAA